MSARKIAFLILIVLFAASVETAWNVREHVDFGPQGCRVMGGRFYGPSWSFEATGERPVTGSALRLEVENAFGGVSVVKGAHGVVKVRLRKVVFLPTEERARQLADRIELRLTGDADVVKVATVTEPTELEAIGSKLIWTSDYAASRLGWKARDPLWVLALRVRRLLEPVPVPWDDGYGGCTSWVELAGLPGDPASVPSEPALSDVAFEARLKGAVEALPTLVDPPT